MMRAIDKPTFSVRVEPAIREALERARTEQRRSLSGMAELALDEWLSANGYYGKTPKRTRKAKARVAA